MSPAVAQVNGPGPSPANLFDIVLDLPGDEAVVTGASRENIGGVLEQTTQLNVTDGGSVGAIFDADSGGEVNISGGTVGNSFNANFGSEVNISGGTVSDGFEALSGSVVNISGGTMGGFFDACSGSEVNISDGTVGRRFEADGGVVNISGGTVGDDFEAYSGSAVNISGGTVGNRFVTHSGSVVNISGGDLGTGFNGRSGSQVNISGGNVGHPFWARSGILELMGGEYRFNGADFSGSTISLTNDDVLTGTLADGSSFIFSAESDIFEDVTLTVVALPPADSSIVIDAPVVSGPSGLREGQTLTLQSGGSLRDNFAVVDATLNVEDGIVGDFAEAANSVVNISGGNVGEEFEAYSGSVVNISGGNVAPSFAARSGSEVNISGGNVSYFFSAQPGSVVNISGGNVTHSWNAQTGSEVNISGGTVGGNIQTRRGSVVNISGGTVGNGFGNVSGVVNISGGTVGDGFAAQNGSTVNISGGTVGDAFKANRSCVVNISGRNFALNGLELDTLIPSEAHTITDRDVELSGLLANGEQFSFQLNSDRSLETDFFDPGATLTVTLVSPVVLGDVNLDGVVDFLDIAPFIAVLSAAEFQAEADIDKNGDVNFLDISHFIGILATRP